VRPAPFWYFRRAMSGTAIDTENLTLKVSEPADVLRWIDAMEPADRAQVSPDWIARVKATTSADPWTCGFAMVHRASGAAVGSCAFKSPPDADGIVEIAYGVNPDHQKLGYATEAALGLVKFAFASGRVRIVRAHTLPATNASTRVLTKCGFEYVGEVIDPEDGLVWRWELHEGSR
jgi:[ribosomal protein S5]-alanine N-acetyltransferase